MKANKAEVEKRVKEVLDLILAGAEHWDVVQYSAENNWGVRSRQLRKYVARAYQHITETIEKDRDKLISRHIAQRRNLYARALNMGDLRTALAVAKDESELLGLYPATNHDVKVAGTIEHTERREFWINLREALKHVPDAYDAVDKILAERITSNEQATDDQH
jgi:hypothetical protein